MRKSLLNFAGGLLLPIFLLTSPVKAQELNTIRFNNSCTAEYSEEEDKYKIYNITCKNYSIEGINKYSINNPDGDNQVDEACYNEICYKRGDNPDSEYEFAFKNFLFNGADELVSPKGDVAKAIISRDIEDKTKKLQNYILGDNPEKVDLKEIGDW